MSMLFLTSGIGKLGAVKDTQQYMEAYGVPGYLVYPAAALEIGGGSMLVMGVHLRWLGQVLAAWCMLTAMIFHTDFADQNQKINFLKNMAMAGGFLVLSATAPPEKDDPDWQPTAGGGLLEMIKCKVANIKCKVANFTDHFIKARGRVALPAEADKFLEKADFMEKGQLLEPDSKKTKKAKEDIAALLQGYRDALVDSDTDAVMSLYAKDSVLMAQNFPSVTGADKIKVWYAECFKRIALDVKFDIKEIVVTSDDYAFASTTSAGIQKDLDSGTTSKEGNHELFVVVKVDDDWKLARYCFSTTNPAE